MSLGVLVFLVLVLVMVVLDIVVDSYTEIATVC